VQVGTFSMLINLYKHPDSTSKAKARASVVLQAYNPSTWEAEAGGLRVWGQPGVHMVRIYLSEYEQYINFRSINFKSCERFHWW
jgi:hypothetical protein